MNIALSGSSGYIGTNLKKILKREGNIKCLYREDFVKSDEEFTKMLKNMDVIINLAGENINRKWTKQNKKRILNSRLDTTRKIVEYINTLDHEVTFINASAVGLYSEYGKHDEDSTNYGKDYLAEVVKKTENEVDKISNPKARVIKLRTGIVIDKNALIIKKLKPVVKFGFGTIIGSGKQPMSCIHMDDLLQLIMFIIRWKPINGVVNGVCPDPGTQKTFMKELGSFYKRPVFLRVPKWIWWLLLGERAILLTSGQEVYPAKAIRHGFYFQHKNIPEIINNL